MAVIHFDSNKQDGERKNASRCFTLNADGSISPAKSPHLALGLREGSGLMPLPGAEGIPVAVAVAIPAIGASVAIVEPKAVNGDAAYP